MLYYPLFFEGNSSPERENIMYHSLYRMGIWAIIILTAVSASFAEDLDREPRKGLDFFPLIAWDGGRPIPPEVPSQEIFNAVMTIITTIASLFCVTSCIARL